MDTILSVLIGVWIVVGFVLCVYLGLKIGKAIADLFKKDDPD